VLMLGHECDEAHCTLMCNAFTRIAEEHPGVDVVCAINPVFLDSHTPANLHCIDAPDYLAALFLLRRARLAFVGPSLHAEAMALEIPLLSLDPPASEAQGRVHLMVHDAHAIAGHVSRLLGEAWLPPRRVVEIDRNSIPELSDADVRVADALAGLRPAAHPTTLTRDAGSPNQVAIRKAWGAS